MARRRDNGACELKPFCPGSCVSTVNLCLAKERVQCSTRDHRAEQW